MLARKRDFEASRHLDPSVLVRAFLDAARAPLSHSEQWLAQAGTQNNPSTERYRSPVS
jgi:hypothetical protein